MTKAIKTPYFHRSETGFPLFFSILRIVINDKHPNNEVKNAGINRLGQVAQYSKQENDKTVIAIKTQATGYSLHNTFGSSDQKCNVKILLMMK